MKVTVKTLKSQQVPFDVEPDMKVAQLKEMIAKEIPTHPVETQKLVALGKVIDDDEKTLADYKIPDNGIIVLMQTKAKPQKKPEEVKQEETASAAVTLPNNAASANASAAADAQPQPVAQPQPQPQPQPSATATQPSAGAGAGAGAGSGGLPPGVTEDALNQVVGITCKPRDQCILALVLSRGQADMACSLLFEGVDLTQLAGQVAQRAGGAGGAGAFPGADDMMADYGDEADMAGDPGAGVGGGAGAGMGGMGGAGIPDNLAQLMNNPQFRQLAQRMRENPQFYQEFMQRLSQDDPDTFTAIQANPMAFMNMIMGGSPNLAGVGGGAGAGAGGMPPGMGGAGAQAAPRRPPSNAIQVNPQQMEAIQRLMSLGFSQHRAAEAFFVCDQNEEFAANYLFENAMQEDEASMNQAIAASQQPAAAEQPPASDAQPQPQPSADQPAAENNEAQPQPQPPADNANAEAPAENNNNNNAGNDGNNDGGNGDAGAGSGAGGETSSFQ